MSKKEFRKLRKQVFNFINEEIIPKYEGLIDCNMYELPSEISWDVEYIFKISKTLPPKMLDELKNNINHDLDDFLINIGEKYYILAILIIFSEI